MLLKTLDLSGNPIGDEGAKVRAKSSFFRLICSAFLIKLTLVILQACICILLVIAIVCSGMILYEVFFCSQCLSDILVNNAGIEKLQLNSTNIGDEVSLLLPSKLVFL